MFHTRKNKWKYFSAGFLAVLMCITQILPASAAESFGVTDKSSTFSASAAAISYSEEDSEDSSTEDALLKITAESSGSPTIPDSATFCVTNEGGETILSKKYSEFKNDGYFILGETDGLTPGETYSVTETNADVSGYSLEITYEVTFQPEDSDFSEDGDEKTSFSDEESDNKVKIVDGEMAEIEIYNNYTKLSSLVIRIKSFGEKSTPGSALITVKNENSGKIIAKVKYSTFQTAGRYVLKNLVPGYYSVTETNAAVSGYDRWGDNSSESIYIDEGEKGVCTITNRYEKKITAKCKKWLNKCKQVGKKLVKYKFRYSNSNTSPTLSKALSKKKLRVCNCSLYVSWCLQQQKAIKKGYRFYTNGSGNIKKGFKKWGKKVKIIEVKKICSKVYLRPGDVVCFASHTAIYAGKGLWYDGGKSATKTGRDKSVYKSVGPKEESYLYNRKVSYIIRIKGL